MPNGNRRTQPEPDDAEEDSGSFPLPSSSRLLPTTLPSAQGLRISGAYQSACRQNGRPPDESPASVPLCAFFSLIPAS
ncbi:unnamed protein product [Gadus morhua 'NCC']